MIDSILIIEDDFIIAGFIEDVLQDSGKSLIFKESAEEAWALLQDEAFNPGLILLDRQLPGMDGIDFLRQLKSTERFQRLPVIMETSMDDQASIQEGLQAGAYYYLTKPLEREIVLTLVNAAWAEYETWLQTREALSGAEKTLQHLYRGEFLFKSIQEGEPIMSALANICPQPEKVITGLRELMINAVEHGNLAISYDEKTQFIKSLQLPDEIAKRLAMPEYRDKNVSVTLHRDEKNIEMIFKDEGDGFDWQKYLEFDPKRAFDPHGRGIAMAKNLSFDSLEYQGNGNTVKVMINI